MDYRELSENPFKVCIKMYMYVYTQIKNVAMI